TPAGGDVGVDGDDVTVAHRGDLRPPGAGGDVLRRVGGLVADDDELRVGRDDGLLGELGVAGAVRVGLVGDVDRAHLLVDGPDEAGAAGGEEGVVQLVVDPQLGVLGR